MQNNHTEFSDDYFNIITTAYSNNINNLKTLLANNPEININARGYKNRTPLMVICGAWPWKCSDWVAINDSSISTILIEAGANINAVDEDGCSALFYATTYGIYHINTLRKAGANFDETLHKMVYMIETFKIGAHPMDICERLLEYSEESDDKIAEQYREIADYINQWFARISGKSK